VLQVLRDPALRARLGAAARRTAEQQYSWTVIGRRMDDLYVRLATAGRNPRGVTTSAP
jgi:glycosyltransferase involved in cell wall biosynthesis